VTDANAWNNLSTGAYCNYDNNPGMISAYGRLYNWFAVNDPRKICPTGFHVPSDTEWKTLEVFLGMTQEQADQYASERGTVEGGKLKEAGTLHWASPNMSATNETGFSATPGGYHEVYGGIIFKDIWIHGYWWTSTENSSTNAIYRALHSDSGRILRGEFDKKSGFSVRCVETKQSVRH
jgi:uncharacterized protein (TIGR02145 family)